MRGENKQTKKRTDKLVGPREVTWKRLENQTFEQKKKKKNTSSDKGKNKYTEWLSLFLKNRISSKRWHHLLSSGMLKRRFHITENTQQVSSRHSCISLTPIPLPPLLKIHNRSQADIAVFPSPPSLSLPSFRVPSPTRSHANKLITGYRLHKRPEYNYFLPSYLAKGPSWFPAVVEVYQTVPAQHRCQQQTWLQRHGYLKKKKKKKKKKQTKKHFQIFS